MAACESYIAARRAAQANADYFHEPFVVFCSTSGVWQCEKLSVAPTDVKLEVFKSKPAEENKP